MRRSLRATAALVDGSSSTRAPSRAIAASCSMVRELPSRAIMAFRVAPASPPAGQPPSRRRSNASLRHLRQHPANAFDELRARNRDLSRALGEVLLAIGDRLRALAAGDHVFHGHLSRRLFVRAVQNRQWDVVLIGVL